MFLGIDRHLSKGDISALAQKSMMRLEMNRAGIVSAQKDLLIQLLYLHHDEKRSVKIARLISTHACSN